MKATPQMGLAKHDGRIRTERIHLLDNVKALLILCVVYGHVALPVYTHTVTLTNLYSTIYLFHMPLFIFVSGFFSKGMTRQGKLRVEKVLSTFTLALVYKVALWLAEGANGSLPRNLLFFSAAPWYLFSLATWYCLIPFFERLRAPYAIGLSLCISLVAGACSEIGVALSMSRTIVFMPYFLLGYYCKDDLLIRVRNNNLIRVTIVLFAVTIVGYLIYGHYELLNDSFYLVYGGDPYRDSLRHGIMWRLVYYFLGGLISLAVVCVAPTKRVAPMAYLGERTLQIYVVHRLLRSLLGNLGFYSLPALQDELFAPLFVAAASVVMVLLSLVPVFGTVFNAIMRMRWGAAVSKQTSE